MGKNDSSRTRVAPLFDQLFAKDASGASWLDGLVGLAWRADPLAAKPQGLRLILKHKRHWGDDEFSISAPQRLLEYLVKNVSVKQVSASGDTGVVRAKREELALKNTDVINEAIAELRTGKRGKHWFVLEGFSRPDALLETDDAVICVEGKRNEHSCTSKTKWMGTRSQLLRHMDAATEAFPGKRVLGLLIVEGRDPNPLEPNSHWKKQCSAQYDTKMLTQSLPHRSDVERQGIAEGVVGVLTWQALCGANQLSWPPVPDVI